MRARFRQSKTARREGVAFQKKPGERECIGEIVRRFRIGFAAQESWKPHQPVAIGLTGATRHRAAGSRRDVNKLGRRAGCGARREIEAKAKLGEEVELKA